MIFPTFVNVKYTDENGFLTSQMQLYNDELNTVLRLGLSDNGWTLPTVTVAQLAEINSFSGIEAMPNGTIWYLSDSGSSTYEVVVKINNALRKVSTTAYP